MPGIGKGISPMLRRRGGDSILPLLVSAIISVDGATIELTYDEPLDETSVAAFGDYSLSGTFSAVSSVGVSGPVVTLTVNTPVQVGETVLIDYTAGANPIRDVAENNAANLTNQVTTNNSTVVFSDEYQAIYDQYVILSATPSGAEATKQNALVTNLVGKNIWTKFKAAWLFGNHSNTGGANTIDVNNPSDNTYQSTLVNNPTFTANSGIKGNASNMYANTNADQFDLFPVSAETNWHYSFGVYVVEDLNPVTGQAMAGASHNGGFHSSIFPRTSGAANARHSSVENATPTIASSVGLHVCTRDSQSEFRYMTPYSKTTVAAVASANTIRPYYGLAWNINSVASNLSENTSGFQFMADPLTDAEFDFMAAALDTYFTP